MNDQKAARWEKWHARGLGIFMAAQIGMVVAFFMFSGTAAYMQFAATAPEGMGIPIWPFIVAPGMMLCIGVGAGLFTWHRNEAAYQKYLERRGSN